MKFAQMFPESNFKIDYSSENFEDNATILFNSDSVQHKKDTTPLKWTEELKQAILAVENLHETFTHIGPKHLNQISGNCTRRISSYLHHSTSNISLTGLLCVAEEIIKEECERFEKQNTSNVTNSEGTQNGVTQGCAELDARQREDNYS